MQEGDSIKLTDGHGQLFEAVIEKAVSKECKVKILSSILQARERDYKIHIALAPTKNISRMEWFLEKATEIGIDEITPLLCEHSERKAIKPERLEKIIIAAAKQSQKVYFPILNPIKTFNRMMQNPVKGQRYIAYLDRENNPSLKEVYQPGKDVQILIGPEGDFSAVELGIAKNSGFVPINLCESRLRTETAALYACFMINCLNHV